jgi:hypothetical protein
MQYTTIPGVSFLLQDALFSTSADSETRFAIGAKRDTKSVGDVSELRVACALAELGYAVSKPLGENQRYDLIADDGDRLQRVQVKTGRIRNGVIVFHCCSTHGHRRSAVKTRPYRGQIELLAVYCPQNQKVYILPEKELTATTAHLRVLPTRNNMKKTIRWASDFELS